MKVRDLRKLVSARNIVDALALTPENWHDLKAFGRFLAGYRRRILLAAGTMLASVLMQLPLPFLTMVVIDRLIQTQDLSLFPLICVGLFVFVITSALVMLVHRLVLAILREHALGTLQMRVIERLQRAPMSTFYHQSSSYLATRIRSDLRSLSGLLAGSLLGAVQSVLLLLGGTISMFVLAPKLALVCLAIAPFFAFTILIFNRRVRELSLAVQESNARFGGVLQESLAGMQVTKAFCAEESSRLRLRHRLHDLIHHILRQEMMASLAQRLIYMIGMIAPLIVLWYGASEYLAGRMTVGQFVAFHSFLSYVFTPLQSLLSQNLQFQSALVSLHRLMEILQLPEESTPRIVRPLPARSDLELDAVEFAYRPGEPVLRGLDLTLAEGETVALVGPSGEGKTSLLRLLLRFHDPDRGRLLLGGVDVRELDLRAYRSRLAIVFQEPYLTSGSVAENLRLARPGASEAELAAAAEQACAHEFIVALPRGYETELGESGVTLSAGQKMRLAIARAMLKDAPILLFDEPTSALDRETEQEVLANLRGYLAQRTALVISHQAAPVGLADRVLTLAEGRICERLSMAAYLESHRTELSTPEKTALAG